MIPYVLGGVVAAAGLWYAVASVWASSVAKHNPDLREGAGEIRYGWRCPRCGRVEAPMCKINKCGGPLVWVQRGARIKCARCHRNYVFSPMFFRQTPAAARAIRPRAGPRPRMSPPGYSDLRNSTQSSNPARASSFSAKRP